LDVDPESKEFSKKVKECQLNTGALAQTKEYISKPNLINSRKLLQKQLKAAEKSGDIILQNELNTKLVVLANYLFQYGLVEESDNIKKQKSALEEIKKKVEAFSDEKKQELLKSVEDVASKKDPILSFAKDSEEKQDWVNALAAYQQALVIYGKLGDFENAVGLTNKIKAILQKIPDLELKIKGFEEEAKKLKASNDNDGAEVQNQYARTIKDAIFQI
jgi:hypothetical protein